jgi:hypothetical protein
MPDTNDDGATADRLPPEGGRLPVSAKTAVDADPLRLNAASIATALPEKV